MLKIAKYDAEIIMDAARTLFQGGNVQFYEVSSFEERVAGKFKLGVNWCAMGTVSPDKAVEFAAEVKAAAEIARAVNDLDLVIDRKAPEISATTDAEYEDAVFSLIAAATCSAGCFASYIKRNLVQGCEKQEAVLVTC